MKKNSNKNTSKSKKLIIIIGVFVLLAATTVAWFVSTHTVASNSFELSNFQTQVDCYFMNGQSRVETTPSYIESGTNMILLSTDENDENYIGNFCVDVAYKGKGNGYLRVKVVTRAKDVDDYVTLTDSKIPYLLSAEYSQTNGNNQAAWFDNRNRDFCYYYATQLSGNDEFTTIHLLNGAAISDLDSGFDLDYLHSQGYTLSVAVESDMVQINRYPQFWGISALPWKG